MQDDQSVASAVCGCGIVEKPKEDYTPVKYIRLTLQLPDNTKSLAELFTEVHASLSTIANVKITSLDINEY